MSELKKRLSSILESPKHNVEEKLEKVCHLLDQEISYFNWTGFYFKNGDKDELKLGPTLVHLLIIQLFLTEKEFAVK